jgi:hypothetical protein
MRNELRNNNKVGRFHSPLNKQGDIMQEEIKDDGLRTYKCKAGVKGVIWIRHAGCKVVDGTVIKMNPEYAPLWKSVLEEVKGK